MELAFHAALVGIGATLAIDAWALVLKQVYGVPSLDYALVGRWIGHMRSGRFRHAGIAASPAIRGERAIGWAAHYAIGILFAGLLVAAFGAAWLRQPTLAPALAIGLLTVAAPFFVMQPCFGFGIAAAKTPNPTAARLRGLITHSVFGIGLYSSASALAQVTAP